MQLKGAIKLLTILLIIICLYQLSFTVVTYIAEKKAEKYAHNDPVREMKYLDSIAGETIYNFFWIAKYNYREVKENEIARGLDLKGGMNVILEVSTEDLLRNLSGYNSDTTFNKALKIAQNESRTSQTDFVTLFGQAFANIAPGASLSSIFNTIELKNKISYNSTNEEVLKILKEETDKAIDNSFQVIRTRIDHFGVVQPKIQKLETTGRIMVELPGVKDPERVRKLLQGTASLEFWETYENTDLYPFLLQANEKIKEIEKIKSDTVKVAEKTPQVKAKAEKADTSSLFDKIAKDTTHNDSAKTPENILINYPLFAILRPNTNQKGQILPGSEVGISHFRDTSKVNYYLNLPQIRSIFPRNVKFMWEIKGIKNPNTKQFTDYYYLHAIKVTTRDGRAPIDGSYITNARSDYAQNKATSEVSMSMNGEGANIWAKLTHDNVGKRIAIVLDGYVCSAPVVNGEISGGQSQITGNFTPQEAKDLATKLESGKMPAPAKIVQEAIVGPTLGKEAINASWKSFALAFLLVLLYMGLYYNKAGWVANIALLCNVFFIIGILASLRAVLTLPGVAGIVLTMGVAVDANVLIYERIREELRAGKGIRLAVADGYKHSYSAIIDSNVTHLLTGIILYVFGTGPIRGFATTLILGILTSLFTAIFISRIIFERMLDKNRTLSVDNRVTKDAFKKVNIDFLGIRKYAYIFSISITIIGLGSLILRGLDTGVDFTGGRNYIVRFDEKVKTSTVQKLLEPQFGDPPSVITYGQVNQVRITTKYRINESDTSVDRDIENRLYMGLKPLIKADITKAKFLTDYRLSSEKIGPTVASDIKRSAVYAVVFALLMIFIYIAIRFKNWQYGLGAVVSLFHDALFVIGLYSLLYGRLPFSLEIDQEFIAAILTVIGYSINDTIIIFDRVREYIGKYPKRDRKEIMNMAMNSTLSRTVNTSGTVIVTLVAIFIFGGEVIQGFIFALLVGTVIGTYSSVFVATPIVYDTISKETEMKGLIRR